MVNNPDKVITHHAVSLKTHTAQDVHEWHKDRWAKYALAGDLGYNPSPTITMENGEASLVGYHDVIEWDGTWIKCREWEEEGIHTRGQNFSSIGVVFMGNNDNHYPSPAQLGTYKNEYYPAVQKRYPSIKNEDQYPHRKYANKSCHGKLLSDSYYINLLNKEDETATKQEMMITITQLMSRLISLLTQRRMK